jgi:hypothetical protein
MISDRAEFIAWLLGLGELCCDLQLYEPNIKLARKMVSPAGFEPATY